MCKRNQEIKGKTRGEETNKENFVGKDCLDFS